MYFMVRHYNKLGFRISQLFYMSLNQMGLLIQKSKE